VFSVDCDKQAAAGQDHLKNDYYLLYY